MIEERQRARSERNWPLADRLREQLREMGVVVQDGEADVKKETAEGERLKVKGDRKKAKGRALRGIS